MVALQARSKLESLPGELLDIILDLVGFDEHKNLHLTSRHLAKQLTYRLFKTIRLSILKTNIETFAQIASLPHLASAVREIYWTEWRAEGTHGEPEAYLTLIPDHDDRELRVRQKTVFAGLQNFPNLESFTYELRLDLFFLLKGLRAVEISHIYKMTATKQRQTLHHFLIPALQLPTINISSLSFPCRGSVPFELFAALHSSVEYHPPDRRSSSYIQPVTLENQRFSIQSLPRLAT